MQGSWTWPAAVARAKGQALPAGPPPALKLDLADAAAQARSAGLSADFGDAVKQLNQSNQVCPECMCSECIQR